MKHFYLALFLFFFQLSFSQLSNFTLQVTTTNETCAGNGSLNFSVSNTTAGASITYNVYLLPNVTTPIANTASVTLTGLASGNYQVVANQSLGADSNSQQQNVTILNQIQNLTFTISHQKVKCGNDGVLTANVLTGTAVTYELLTGPVTMTAQASNQFSGLPIGNYTIRVFDTCGNAVVNSFTLIQSYTPITITSVDDVDLTCTHVKLRVSTNFGSSSVAFPLNVQIKVYPPSSGSPIIYTQTVTTYSIDGIEQLIDRFDGDYYYDVKITDACGNITELNNNLLNKDLGFSVANMYGCMSKIKIAPSNVILPYTIEFLSSPPGYNPVTLNPGFPGPYSTPDVELFVEVGNYTIKVTDACGKTHIENFQSVILETPILEFVPSFGCGAVTFSIDPLYNVTMVSVILISAPAAYSGVLPENMSIYLSGGGYNWSYAGFPPGNYVFEILDSCGVLHTKSITIGTGGGQVSMNVVNYPECQLGYGSVYIYYNSSTVSSVMVISAPSNFPFPLPYAVPSAGINSFALINVPEGSYTLEMTNSCGGSQTNVLNVESYYDLNTSYEIEQFCSSFNLKFTQQGNAFQPFYGLQKLNEVTGNWEHPVTGFQIINNVIDSSNFYSIAKNQWNINLTFIGKFRILEAYGNFSSELCIQPVQEFEVLGHPKVLNHNVLSCGNNLSVVQLNAVGIGQLIYRITEKDNLPFVVNNGTSNVFVNLQPAIYNFQIEDTCGNILNQQIQIVPSLSIQITPNLCENQLSNLTVNNYTFLQYEWWKNGNPTNILSTTNVLTFNPFITATHSGTYSLRITHVGHPTSCLNSVMTYIISSQAVPSAGLDNAVNFCGSQNLIDLNLLLSGTFDTNGTWQEITTSNTSLINGVWDASTVTYDVYKFKYIVNGFCGTTDEAIITLTINEKPIIGALPTIYSVCAGEDVEINPGITNLNFTNQWTGPNGFSSTNSILQFNNLQTISNGQYSLIVSNNGCNSEPYNFVVDVASLPDFYINETCENNVKTVTAVPFEGTFDSALNLNWTGPNGFSSSSNPIQIVIGQEGNYILTIEKNTCEISKGITVTSIACEIPRGVSPNGDGLNDYFDLSAFDVRTLKIYNRYGKIVYSKDDGYLKEWYGQADNGNILSDATYFYAITLNSGEGKTGWVYVIR